ncbi:YMGG-like glycine zipper-containing protein [Albibacterium sp.]|uniref:YMGG-like glycine zipper-containing protein n=1 Tax=Albibacterium sp. TaxID=2952885 RepID=UPI002CCDDAFF|nr:YMGG-like glycine zipper-containing protein [Albibacterium sp.]HUH18714.1 YMGG-like glycine zipper-containing protein [Albibacterium sp.]
MKNNTITLVMLFAMSIGILTACNNASGTKEDTLAKEMADKRISDSLKLDSFKTAEAAKAALAEQEESKSYSKKESNVIPTSNTSTVIHASPEATQQQEKKGWSDAAKGTAIGAGVGAIGGALIDKDKPVRGAAIGAAIGGGSGYAIGRKSDRESGRVEKKD